MTINANHLEKLKEISGPKGWIDNQDDMPAFLTEPRGKFQGRTPLILLPDRVENIAAIIRYCAGHKIPVVPQGGNSGLVGGSIPDMTGDEILLSLKRLNRIRERDIHNQTITVEAGCILSDIQELANDMDHLFPLSLAAEGSCMIGGNLSTNAGGVNVLHYGPMRSLVLGLEVVLPDGDIWHGLSGLQKDNSGYDLKQLFIGAEGTLGIITAATLKIFPYPHQKQTALVAVPDPEAAIDLLTTARNISGNCITAFEIMPRLGVEIVTRHMPQVRYPMAASYDWYVLLECTSSLNRDLLDLEQVMERILGQAMDDGLILDGVMAKNQAESDNLWHLRENLSEAQKAEGGSIKHDISVPISAIPDFLTEAGRLVEATIPGGRPIPFGHLGDGNLHYNISQPQDMDRQEFLNHWEMLNQRIHDLVREFKGSFSAEHGIGRLKTADMQHYKSRIEMTLMKKIKNTLDPDNIMNPGVIFGDDDAQDPDFQEKYYYSQDGLRLYYRDYNQGNSDKTPLLCLHGLTRNVRDFNKFARHFSAEYRVICLDMRGRGNSEYDPDYMNYQIPTYAQDVLTFLEHEGLEQVIAVGTSMGGLIAMVVGVMRPDVMKAIILNDIGPEIDPKGIERIAGFVGNGASFQGWPEAVAAMKVTNAALFPDYSDEDWEIFTQNSFREQKDGTIIADYDQNIGTAMRENAENAIPVDLWTMFKALTPIPIMTLRGENSDILAPETLAKMAREYAEFTSLTVPNRAHTPDLGEKITLEETANFIKGL
ncbi:D-2-hydroxyglutarate dehydrogenase [hydrothermal vent metagenome]|uniref:D-2-hydroxyglutarate dehydrogenase n=1 Tax=hydrothermal vent metagenome TaxID=652676 RepID=A0A3B0THP8_9ZZZZ